MSESAEDPEQKEEAPGCSSNVTSNNSSFSRYPSRQKKLGPAPFASFEDLNDDAYPSIQAAQSSSKAQQRMPEIQEDTARSPELDSNLLDSGRCSIGGTSAPFSPPSGPTSGLQTPSTPRIDISCASSGTPQSESSSERELFQCSLGLAFHEDGAEDLRSSTEELDLGPENPLGDKPKPEDTPEDIIRRASHPANLFRHQGKISVSPDLDEQVRKLSTHSMCLDGIHSRSTRHSSFGAADGPRPGAHSSLSAHSNVSGRRSSSPHKMLYETSFCGNKPIPTPSMDLGDSPSQPKEGILIPTTMSTPMTSRKIQDTEGATSSNRLKQDSDSSLSQTLDMLTETTIQVHHHHCSGSGSGAATGSGTPPNKRWSSRSGGSPDSPGPSSPKPTTSGSTSTKSKPREIPKFTNNKSNFPHGENAQKSITSNKSSSVESEAAQGSSSLPQKCKSTSTPEEAGRNAKLGAAGVTDDLRGDADAPIETKGLFLQESQDQDDDDELPYVPTTLPMEKSAVLSMVPVKQRRFDFSMTTSPIQRPRCINPPNPASLSDYIVHTAVNKPQDVNSEEGKKMKINLPREDSASEIPVNPKSPKTKKGPGPTSWTDFAEMGLRSPREIRRKMKEENGTTTTVTRELCSYQSSDPSEGSMTTNWSDGDTESLQTA